MHKLPSQIRRKLREPIGKLITDEKKLIKLLKKEKHVVSIGDLVTYTLLKNNINPVICIVDYIIKRKKYSSTNMKEAIQQFKGKHIKIRNPPGFITDELWKAIESAYKELDKNHICIEVEGEEDLAALPAILLAPKDVTIIYGLPNKGVLVVKATSEHKKKVKEVLDKM
ncbi:MAG: DUF359 domain-containing protein [Thermoplasmata archaeon]|nr:MAG: DUF359 domain-containing protein [Thermoplasmata archaeon]